MREIRKPSKSLSFLGHRQRQNEFPRRTEEDSTLFARKYGRDVESQQAEGFVEMSRKHVVYDDARRKRIQRMKWINSVYSAYADGFS